MQTPENNDINQRPRAAPRGPEAGGALAAGPKEEGAGGRRSRMRGRTLRSKTLPSRAGGGEWGGRGFRRGRRRRGRETGGAATDAVEAGSGLKEAMKKPPGRVKESD